jgi:hypothetical protein
MKLPLSLPAAAGAATAARPIAQTITARNKFSFVIVVPSGIASDPTRRSKHWRDHALRRFCADSAKWSENLLQIRGTAFRTAPLQHGHEGFDRDQTGCANKGEITGNAFAPDQGSALPGRRRIYDHQLKSGER